MGLKVCKSHFAIQIIIKKGLSQREEKYLFIFGKVRIHPSVTKESIPRSWLSIDCYMGWEREIL